jgi:hypothetical protein
MVLDNFEATNLSSSSFIVKNKKHKKNIQENEPSSEQIDEIRMELIDLYLSVKIRKNEEIDIYDSV